MDSEVRHGDTGERGPVDFGRTARDYAAYRSGFPERLFDRLRDMGVGLAGQRVLDLGTGTGALARGFARGGCRATGVDPAAALLDEARRLDAAAGIEVDYRIGTAEDTGLGDGACDVVAAGQCWHWFDRQRVASEARRLLVAGGAVVICHRDYLPLRGNVCEATEELVLERNPAWTMAGGTGIHGDWAVDVGEAGFVDVETFSFDKDVTYTHEQWRGRMRTATASGRACPTRQSRTSTRPSAGCWRSASPGSRWLSRAGSGHSSRTRPRLNRLGVAAQQGEESVERRRRVADGDRLGEG